MHLYSLLMIGLISFSAVAQDYPWDLDEIPWPLKTHRSLFRETRQEAVNSEPNWSGAHWNPISKTLWLCNNKWGVRSYRFDPIVKTFVEDKKFSFDPVKKYDFESITQEDLNKDVFLLINEKHHRLQEFDLSGDSPKLLREWNLGKITKKDESFEGMMFIPNSVLKKAGFVDHKGDAFTEAKNGHAGIIIVSDQKTGDLYALDLKDNGDYDEIGRYFLPLESTRGLEFNYATGKFYALDGNQFAEFNLKSKKFEMGKHKGRAFQVTKLYEGPGPDGAEGLAMAQDLVRPGVTSVFITDDDNTSANDAVHWYNIKF